MISSIQVLRTDMVIDVIGFGDGDWGVGNSPGILGERNDWTEVAEMENIASDSRVTGSNYFIYDPFPNPPHCCYLVQVLLVLLD